MVGGANLRTPVRRVTCCASEKLEGQGFPLETIGQILAQWRQHLDGGACGNSEGLQGYPWPCILGRRDARNKMKGISWPGLAGQEQTQRGMILTTTADSRELQGQNSTRW